MCVTQNLNFMHFALATLASVFMAMLAYIPLIAALPVLLMPMYESSPWLGTFGLYARALLRTTAT